MKHNRTHQPFNKISSISLKMKLIVLRYTFKKLKELGVENYKVFYLNRAKFNKLLHKTKGFNFLFKEELEVIVLQNLSK